MNARKYGPAGLKRIKSASAIFWRIVRRSGSICKFGCLPYLPSVAHKKTFDKLIAPIAACANNDGILKIKFTLRLDTNLESFKGIIGGNQPKKAMFSFLKTSMLTLGSDAKTVNAASGIASLSEVNILSECRLVASIIRMVTNKKNLLLTLSRCLKSKSNFTLYLFFISEIIQGKCNE